MKKNEVIKNVAAKLECSQAKADEILTKIIEVYKDGLAAGESMELFGICNFIPELKPERERRNPKTGEKLIQTAHFEIRTKISPKLKELIKNKLTKLFYK